MKTFNQYVAEALDKPYDFDPGYASEREHKFHFETEDGTPMHVAFVNMGLYDTENFKTSDKSWAMSFGIGSAGRYEATNKNTDHFRVMATVKDIAQYWLIEQGHIKDIDLFMFSSKTTDKGRTKLYKRLAKHFMPKGWTIIEKQIQGQTIIALMPENKVGEIVRDV